MTRRLGVLLGVLLLGAVGRASDLPSRDSNPYVIEIARLREQAVTLENEIIHQRAEVANCKATVDSLELTTQVGELVKRYEAVYGGTWAWDDRQRRVVQTNDSKETAR